jgi:flagellar protein FlgJ
VVDVPGARLYLRTGPSTVNGAVRAVADGSSLAVTCQVYGQLIIGLVRRTAFWDRLSDGAYASDGYVRWAAARPVLPWCGSPGATLASARTTGRRLVARAVPRASGTAVGSVASGVGLFVACQAWGQRRHGGVRTSRVWYRLAGPRRYVSAADVAWSATVPSLPFCGQVGATTPAATPAAFIARAARSARAGYRRYRVPASVTLAQAVLESGYGRSWLARRDHNYFGIKCFRGDRGTVALGCRSYPTSECDRTKGCFRTRAQFRAYRDPTASFVDHGYFLRSRGRYRAAFRYTRDPDRFARAIHRAGYATSPRYATSLIRLMRKYRLYRYDP